MPQMSRRLQATNLMVGSIYVHLCKRKLSAVVNVHFVHCGAQCLICSLYFAVFYAQCEVLTVHLCKKTVQCTVCSVQCVLCKCAGGSWETNLCKWHSCKPELGTTTTFLWVTTQTKSKQLGLKSNLAWCLTYMESTVIRWRKISAKCELHARLSGPGFIWSGYQAKSIVSYFQEIKWANLVAKIWNG